MKIKKRIAAIILLGCCAGLTTPAIAQKKNKLKKGPNISLNISAKKDSIKTTYLNLGLLTNIYRLQGVGINAISSVVQSDMTGFQVSGLASITGRHASGTFFHSLSSPLLFDSQSEKKHIHSSLFFHTNLSNTRRNFA